MSNAADRRAARALWAAPRVFRGTNVHAELDGDAVAEWSAMTPLDRLALTWALSLEQYGAADDATMEPRLPRSAYRLERR